MALPSHIFRRGAAYSARMRVPLDLVDIMGKQELVKALGTSDLAEAKRRLYPVIAAWQREFDDMRTRRALVPADREHAVWDHYTSTLDRDDQERANLPGEAKIEAARAEAIERIEREDISGLDKLAVLNASIEVMAAQRAGEVSAEHRKVKLAELRKHLVKNETALIAHEVDDYLQKNRLLVQRGTPDWISLARHMMRAEVEALQRTLERDRGDYTGRPADPLVKPATGQRRAADEVAPPGESIAEALAAFKTENPNNVSKGRIEEACRDVGIFIDMDGIGPTFPVGKITKLHVRDWKALLMKYPLRATEVVGFKGLNINAAVARNGNHNRPTLSDRTVNRYLSSLSAFLSWANINGYIASNPCSRMSLRNEKRSKTLTFTTDQMNTLFKSPLFAGAQSTTEWRLISRPGAELIRDARYWVPLVMLYSGARPGEIAQLAISDVRQEHGHWIMHITNEGEATEEGKSVKTEGSMRIVPIHPELVRLGFLKYHAERMKAKDGSQLFPDATRNERGQMMSKFSREFGKYLTRIGLKVGRGLSLYSFRHGAIDAFRRAGYLDEQFKFLLGHGKGTMTGRYGTLPQGMLEHRVELVNSIGYPGLVLDHLVG